MANTITPTPSSPGFRVVPVGTGRTYADTAAFVAYCKTQDVKSNQEILCGEFYESQVLPYIDFEALGGKTNDSYYYLLRPVPGMDQAYDGDGAPVAYANSGIEMVFNTANPPRMRTGFRVEGFNVRFTGTVNNSPALNMQYDFSTGDKLPGFRKNRIFVEVAGTFAIRVGLDGCGLSLEDNAVFFAANCSAALYFNGLATVNEYRNTYVRLGASGYIGLNDNSGVKDSNVYFNMGGASYAAYGGGSASYSNNISDNAAETHSGFTVVAPATMFAGNGDYRPKTGGSLIGAASSSAANTTDLFSKPRGSAPNAGAIQRDYIAGAPQGTITSTNVSITTGNKRSVTISGTTNGAPTSGSASITPTSVSGNHAVAQSNVSVTLGDGTFTVTFSDVKVGQYGKTITLTNATGSSNISDGMLLNVIGATGTITNQPAPNGQLQSISGTTSGSPDSGTITWPANAAAANTSNQGPFSLTLGTGTFSDIDRALPPGTYDAPIYDFTIPAGTSIPSSSGGSAVFINGISGNPQAPDPGTSNATVTSVTVSPSTASVAGTGTQQFTATVAGTNSPPQTVMWTASAGSISSSGLFTAPASTSSNQTVTVTATSAFDNTKFGTATLTVSAGSVMPVVTTVTVSPPSATVQGGASQTFFASVTGQNNPPTTVTWSATAGSISSIGIFTAPPANQSAQTVTVTATSTFDGTKSGSATVTIPAMALPTVTSVLVSPAVVAMIGGGVRQFAAQVLGTGSPSQSVTWSTSIGSISPTGLYTAPGAELEIATAVITATSTYDASKSGTASAVIAAIDLNPSIQQAYLLSIDARGWLSGDYFDLRGRRARIDKVVGERQVYGIDLTAWLAARGTTLFSATVRGEGITIDSRAYITNGIIMCWVKGGKADEFDYSIPAPNYLTIHYKCNNGTENEYTIWFDVLPL